MQIVATTNDPVRLSFIQALLQDAGIASVLLDAYASGVDGSIGAVPRRLVVDDAAAPAARRVLLDAGETPWS